MFETLKNIDTNLFLCLNSAHSLLFDKIQVVISNDFFIYPFIALFLFIVFKKHGGKAVATLVLGIGLCVAFADISSNLTKHTVKRYRPSHNLIIKNKVHVVNEYRGGKYGFFSSHAANTFAITTLLFLSAATFLNKKIRLLFFLLPIVIGYSRIYLGVHYPSDILVGAIDGLIVGWVVHKLLNTYFNKKR